MAFPIKQRRALPKQAMSKMATKPTATGAMTPPKATSPVGNEGGLIGYLKKKKAGLA